VFNFSGSEIVFLLLAGLVVLGPERLPGVIRQAGKLYGDLRRTTQDLEKELRGTFDEPLKDLRATADSIRAGFGEVDDEPSPPMRAEQSAALTPEQLDEATIEASVKAEDTSEKSDG
jgi:sec-independent protein translocase protein TatB